MELIARVLAFVVGLAFIVQGVYFFVVDLRNSTVLELCVTFSAMCLFTVLGVALIYVAVVSPWI